MKTHGGRSFLHGHLFGDNCHEYFAPCIYEGEGDAGMAFFNRGKAAWQDILLAGRPGVGAARRAATEHGQPDAFIEAWPVLVPYAKWLLGERFGGLWLALALYGRAANRTAQFAIDGLSHMAREISGAMRKHQLHGQSGNAGCRISLRVQNLVTMLVTALMVGDSTTR